jgi:hypothetical protein
VSFVWYLITLEASPMLWGIFEHQKKVQIVQSARDRLPNSWLLWENKNWHLLIKGTS